MNRIKILVLACVVALASGCATDEPGSDEVAPVAAVTAAESPRVQLAIRLALGRQWLLHRRLDFSSPFHVSAAHVNPSTEAA